MYIRKTIGFNDESENGRKIAEWIDLQPNFSDSICSLILLSIGINPNQDLEKRVLDLEREIKEFKEHRRPPAIVNSFSPMEETGGERKEKGMDIPGVDNSLLEYFSNTEE